MCQRVTCGDCGRPDWRGCGAHVEQVLGDVPVEDRCKCREGKPAEGKPREAAPPGFLGRLLGRR